MEEQVGAIYAGNEGFLDDIPTPQVSRFQDELREHLRAEETIYTTIRESGDLPDEVAEKLTGEIEKFKNSFNIQEESVLT
jgi:F-type H+-transporting ATPase subunit alpha